MERSETSGGLRLDEWLDAVRDELVAAGTEAPVVTRDEQRALLEMARIAAHRSERIAAPITSFLLGLALAGRDPAARAEAIGRLAGRLEERPGSAPAR